MVKARHLSFLLSLILFLALFSLLADAPLLAEERVVYLVTLDWPPYIGQGLTNRGYIAEIVIESFARVGYKVHLDFLPWNRALYLAQRGDYDGLVAAYYTEEREEFFCYHDSSLGQSEIVFMTLAHREIQYKTMEDLKGYRIGITKGFAYPTVFEEADYLEKEEAIDTKSLLKLLLGGRVDLIVEDRLVLYHLLEEELRESVEEVRVVEPILDRKQLFVAFSTSRAGYFQTVSAFGRGLSEVKRDGTFEAIRKSHGL